MDDREGVVCNTARVASVGSVGRRSFCYFRFERFVQTGDYPKQSFKEIDRD